MIEISIDSSSEIQKMEGKIWKILAQILFYRNDLIGIIKPFFENLKNENINDEKYIPLLKTFSKYQLELLYQNEIIPNEKFNFLISKNEKESQNESSSQLTDTLNDSHIEEIISGDKIKEFQEIIQEKNINTFNIIIKSFLDVEKMEIPLIQYCIMKKAIECFKYLLVNGYDDPNKTMKEQSSLSLGQKSQNRYKWDCMATAIYFGNKEIIKILETKGIEKLKNSKYIEAAILSYRNHIVEELLEEINKKKDKNHRIKNHLMISLISSTYNNNIKGAELIISKGADINAKTILYLKKRP